MEVVLPQEWASNLLLCSGLKEATGSLSGLQLLLLIQHKRRLHNSIHFYENVYKRDLKQNITLEQTTNSQVAMEFWCGDTIKFVLNRKKGLIPQQANWEGCWKTKNTEGGMWKAKKQFTYSTGRS